MPILKKKTKVKVEEPKVALKTESPVEDGRVAKYRKLMNEATTPEKVIEYRFWMETYQGKNPAVPKHMS